MGTSARRMIPMSGRDPVEVGRTATTLELMFDLTFVIGFGTAANEFAGYLAHGQVRVGVTGFLLATFAVAWAWMNWSWFASAYDTDDWVYRLLTMVTMIGVLILALGLPRLFDSLARGGQVDTTTMVLGYVVMRVPMVIQWLRAAKADPPRRQICRLYAWTIAASQTGWVLLAVARPSQGPAVAGALVLSCVELLGPILVARYRGGTPWHPHHIAERYGLLIIIALGEGLIGTASSLGAILGPGGSGWSLDFALIGLAGVGVSFGVWWSYFIFPSGLLLQHHRERSALWGYGHIPLFIAVVAIGAGLHVAAYRLDDDSALGPVGTVWSVAIPVAIYVALLYGLFVALTRAHDPLHLWLVLASAALVPAALVMAGAGLALSWCLLVLAVVPWVTVAGYELVGHRHQAERLTDADTVR
jgi:low temperature requirement protein LtrA